jgi:hypothetical protein
MPISNGAYPVFCTYYKNTKHKSKQGFGQVALGAAKGWGVKFWLSGLAALVKFPLILTTFNYSLHALVSYLLWETNN